MPEVTEIKCCSITIIIEGKEIEFTEAELACMGIDANQFKELLSNTLMPKAVLIDI